VALSTRLRTGAAAVLAAVLVLLAVCASNSAAWARASSTDLPVVYLSELPPEARHTIVLIRRRGPLPYERDGAVFGNFEGLLPRHERGYYREYTVPTPGLAHRGTRRIIAGRAGELYYTDDHYRSFKRIRE
jgi:ribonuclease T1